MSEWNYCTVHSPQDCGMDCQARENFVPAATLQAVQERVRAADRLADALTQAWAEVSESPWERVGDALLAYRNGKHLEPQNADIETRLQAVQEERDIALEALRYYAPMTYGGEARAAIARMRELTASVAERNRRIYGKP